MGWFVFTSKLWVSQRGEKNNSYRFNVKRGDKELYNMYDTIFQRGEIAVRRLTPYPAPFEVPPLPDPRKTGIRQGGFHHISDFCLEYSFVFEKNCLTYFFTLYVNRT